MTAEEFKKTNPHLSHLEGDALFNAMEDYWLKQNEANEIIKQIKPIWKTHTLRWLFYVRKKNLCFGKNDWSASKICDKCRKGVSSFITWSTFSEDGKGKSHSYCPHCGKEMNRVDNDNVSHKLYKFTEKLKNWFWWVLDKSHIARYSIEGRYGMFGDEARYVKSWTVNMKSGEEKANFKKRKWWEYILIEQPYHNF